MIPAAKPATAHPPVAAGLLTIERRSIDWIPHAERHGSVRHLGALWFVGNANLTAMATGVATLTVGASLGWTIIATVLGSLFGTLFMALHSAQGPQLGLPQLVQSRTPVRIPRRCAHSLGLCAYELCCLQHVRCNHVR